jgi:hypothetical protein
VQHALRAAHLPQHVDVDRALAARHLVGALDLRDGAVDRIADQLLVPLAPGQRVIDLRDDPAFGIVAVGIDRRPVPMPPAAAQAPELAWLVAETPLPPSTSGQTSRPP